MTTTTKDIARALDAKVEAIADEGLRARMVLCQRAYETTIASGVPNRFNGEWPS
jgi:hypothetical protein